MITLDNDIYYERMNETKQRNLPKQRNWYWQHYHFDCHTPTREWMSKHNHSLLHAWQEKKICLALNATSLQIPYTNFLLLIFLIGKFGVKRRIKREDTTVWASGPWMNFGHCVMRCCVKWFWLWRVWSLSWVRLYLVSISQTSVLYITSLLILCWDCSIRFERFVSISS